MSTTDYVIDVIGFSAGVLIASSLVAQIWRAHKLRSALDLSYFWQGTVATGVSLQLIYLSHYSKWAVFVPLFCELNLMIYLIGLKMFYEQHLSCLGLGRGRGDPDGGDSKLGASLLDGVEDSAGRSGGGSGGAGNRTGGAHTQLDNGETEGPTIPESPDSRR